MWVMRGLRGLRLRLEERGRERGGDNITLEERR